ncbi:MAG TPA: hypothetical protein VNG31_06855 [Candidatus Baltobacteraceae bacterium]|nr:hypothetical protein [Candidatus Baltobacteraceae bacterium]
MNSLKKQLVIGSAIDPTNGDQNPYGLAIATTSYQTVKKGSLYVCNFNNSANVQGSGTTIESLTAVPGSSPVRFAQSNALLGCSALAMDVLPNTWSTASRAKALTPVMPSGSVGKSYKGKSYVEPWGVTYATTGGIYPTSAIFVSDASTGSIVLAQSCNSGNCVQPGTAIVTGFAVNHGKPGSILGPSGLQFDPKNCVKIGGRPACGTLYVVDGKTNTVVAIHNVLNLRKAKSIVVSANGKTFSGPEGKWASLLHAGNPLKGPISSALFYNGNLVVGNTLNPKGTNLMVELSPAGKVLATRNVDKGAAGALFGMVATGSNAATTKLYFNDDNANNVQVLQR